MTKEQKRDLLRSAATEAASQGGKASERAIADALAESGMDRRVAERMAREARLLAQSGSIPPPAPPAPEEPAALYPGDLEALRAAGPTPLLCAMLLCLRARPHPSGRIRYGDAELMACAGIRGVGEYRAAFAALASAGLVSCAVVGSRNPTPTLSLPWAPEPSGEPTGSIPFARGEGKRLARRLAKEDEE